MSKKPLLVVVYLLFAFSIAVIPAQAAAPSIVLNGQILQCDTPPMVEDGSALVPMRPVFDALGAQINWDDPTKTVTAATYDTTVEVVIGGDVKVNGQKLNTSIQAQIYNSATMLPLPLINEALGADVDWNPATQTVTITTATKTTPDPIVETEIPEDTVTDEEENIETGTTDGTITEDEDLETGNADGTITEDEDLETGNADDTITENEDIETGTADDTITEDEDLETGTADDTVD